MRYLPLRLLPLLVSVNLLGQINIVPQYEAVYDYFSTTDTLNPQTGKHEDYLLYAYDDVSRFLPTADYFNDSMKHVFWSENQRLRNPKTQEEAQEAFDAFKTSADKWRKKEYSLHRTEKLLSEGRTLVKHHIIMPMQHLDFPLLQDWTIEEEQATIAGLDCQRARITYGGRTYTAWFAPDVPIPDGPYVFAGLPGLIVKVADEQNWFAFTLKSYTPNPTERFWRDHLIDPRSQPISRESFVSQTHNFMRNPQIIGVNQDEELLLRKRKEYATQFHLLLESQ